MKKEACAKYLNTDLEIRSKKNLRPLLEALDGPLVALQDSKHQKWLRSAPAPCF